MNHDAIEALPTTSGMYTVDELPSFQPLEGVTMSLLPGARMLANWVRIEPGAEVANHSHPHEQVGLVVEGEVMMTIDGETKRLVPGHCYCIAGDVEHGAVAGPEGAVVVDIFSPPRADYIEQLDR